jgi:hypothetical protein
MVVTKKVERNNLQFGHALDKNLYTTALEGRNWYFELYEEIEKYLYIYKRSYVHLARY